MATRSVKHEPAPTHVIQQIRSGDLLDQTALLDWYVNRCPKWLRLSGCSPDVAALLSHLPNPRGWAHAQMVGK